MLQSLVFLQRLGTQKCCKLCSCEGLLELWLESEELCGPQSWRIIDLNQRHTLASCFTLVPSGRRYHQPLIRTNHYYPVSSQTPAFRTKSNMMVFFFIFDYNFPLIWSCTCFMHVYTVEPELCWGVNWNDLFVWFCLCCPGVANNCPLRN